MYPVPTIYYISEANLNDVSNTLVHADQIVDSTKQSLHKWIAASRSNDVEYWRIHYKDIINAVAEECNNTDVRRKK
jgi:hypothetical protein